MERGEGALVLLSDGHEVAGLVVDNDLRDATDHGADDRGLAGHRFKVDDAEGLVDRRAAKHGGTRVELDDVGLVDHLIDPVDALAGLAGFGHGGFHLGGDLFGVGCTGAEHDVVALVHIFDRFDEVDNTLLASDTADEEDERFVVGDVKLIQNRARVDGVVLLGVDAIVDDMHLIGGDVEVLQDVRLGALRDCDDGIRHFQCSLFDPAAEIVTAGELLALPGA